MVLGVVDEVGSDDDNGGGVYDFTFTGKVSSSCIGW